VITAIYPDARRKLITIKETVPLCPFFGGDLPLGEEFAVLLARNGR